MKFSEVMAYYNYKVVNIMRAIHVARDTVKSWQEKDQIPFKMQCMMQVLSDGKLQADKEAWLKGEIE